MSGENSLCLHDVVSHQLHEVPSEVVELLFRNEAVVSLLISGLPDACKLIICRLAPLKEAAPWPPLVAWVAGNHKLLKDVITTLRGLRILNLITQPPPSLLSTPNVNHSRSSEVGSAVSAGSSLAQPTSVRSAKYELDKNFRDTYLALVSNVFHPKRFSCFQFTTFEEECRMDAPDASALQAFAQGQWSNLLKWLFAQSVKTPGVTQKAPPTRPGPALEEILNLRNLMAKPDPPNFAKINPQATQRPRVSRAAFQWLLSDLSEQLTTLLFGYLEGLQHGSISAAANPTEQKGSIKPQDPQIRSAHILTLLCHIARAKIGQPLVLKSQISPEEEKFITLCRDLGVVMHGSAIFNGHNCKILHPTPLARILAVDVSRDITSPDSWALSQMFGARAYQDWQDSGSVRRFGLAKQRYHTGCVTRSRGVLPPLPFAEAEFDWHSASDIFAEFPEGDLAEQPLSLQAAVARANKSASTVKGRGIVVESNFRVFAYRPDELEIPVLSNLCEIKILSPSLVVGILTRDSVMNAFSEGLTANQIIRFFSAHAHSSVKRRNAVKSKEHDSTSTIVAGSNENVTGCVLPENVSNQLVLWREQRSSITMTDACLFEFTDEQELMAFTQLIARAKLNQSLLCHTPISKAASQVGSSEFLEWTAEIMRRVKAAGQHGVINGSNQIGSNWFASGAVIVIKAENKAEFTRHLKQARSVRRATC